MSDFTYRDDVGPNGRKRPRSSQPSPEAMAIDEADTPFRPPSRPLAHRIMEDWPETFTNLTWRAPETSTRSKPSQHTPYDSLFSRLKDEFTKLSKEEARVDAMSQKLVDRIDEFEKKFSERSKKDPKETADFRKTTMAGLAQQVANQKAKEENDKKQFQLEEWAAKLVGQEVALQEREDAMMKRERRFVFVTSCTHLGAQLATQVATETLRSYVGDDSQSGIFRSIRLGVDLPLDSATQAADNASTKGRTLLPAAGSTRQRPRSPTIIARQTTVSNRSASPTIVESELAGLPFRPIGAHAGNLNRCIEEGMLSSEESNSSAADGTSSERQRTKSVRRVSRHENLRQRSASDASE